MYGVVSRVLVGQAIVLVATRRRQQQVPRSPEDVRVDQMVASRATPTPIMVAGDIPPSNRTRYGPFATTVGIASTQVFRQSPVVESAESGRTARCRRIDMNTQNEKMKMTRLVWPETVAQTLTTLGSEGEFVELVASLLERSDLTRRGVLADNASWFAATTVGISELDEGEIPGSPAGKQRVSPSAEVVVRLLSDAAVIFDDGLEDGDIEQATDAVGLGAGLLALAERCEPTVADICLGDPGRTASALADRDGEWVAA